MSRAKNKDARFDVRVSREWLDKFDAWLSAHHGGKARSEWLIEFIDKAMAGQSITDYDIDPDVIKKLEEFSASRRPPAKPSDVIVAAIVEYIENS